VVAPVSPVLGCTRGVALSTVDEKEKKDDENKKWRSHDSPLRSPLITQLERTISNAINGCLPTQIVLIVVTYIYQPIDNVFNISTYPIAILACDTYSYGCVMGKNQLKSEDDLVYLIHFMIVHGNHVSVFHANLLMIDDDRQNVCYLIPNNWRNVHDH
jgi:hypothetical protein